jgi:GDP-L-fucose synthase
MIDRDAPIYVAGHRGMVGGAVKRALEARGHRRIVTATRDEADLADPAAVEALFARHRPAYVVLAAAKVGGIVANDRAGGDFIRENLRIQTNVIDAAFRHGARRFVFLGSSCIYPRDAVQPIREAALLTGPLEPTNLPYAVAKIAGVAMCDAYRRQYGFDAFTVMPCNVYGIGDNLDPDASHVVAGLMRRFHAAKLAGAREVVAWGTGRPLRELMDADDLADAILLLMDRYRDGGLINAGSGEEVSIRELAEAVAEATGFAGKIAWNAARPDGTPRKLMDSGRLAALGWRPSVPLGEGLRKMYAWFLETPAGRGAA